MDNYGNAMSAAELNAVKQQMNLNANGSYVMGGGAGEQPFGGLQTMDESQAAA